MTKALTRDDIRDFLNRFASAIMRDQVHVDALPPEKFHPQYNGDMWLAWRLDHLAAHDPGYDHAESTEGTDTDSHH